MSDTQQGARERRQLRLWPGVVAVILQWLLWLVVPVVLPGAILYALMGVGVCALAILVWWALFSRVPPWERLGFLVLTVAGPFAARFLVDKSIATGMMGMMFMIYAIPTLSLALVAGTVIGSRMADGLRRATMAAAILIGCGIFLTLRTKGMTGDAHSQFAWRWAKTSEQRMLDRVAAEPPAVPPPAPAKVEAPPEPPPLVVAAKLPARPPEVPRPAPRTTGADWPGFRGPHRDDVVTGVRIKTDWASSPPVEIWRRPVGPGWSSFAVRDGLIYTQEQRGESEVVACYDEATGKPAWTHQDAARFWESNGGAGPRATPTLHDGRVYTFGATGILNALDARTGAVVWTRNGASDAEAKLPGWGFSSSPLVVGDLVIVAASGRIAAFDLATGSPRWLGPKGGVSYSSPQLLTIGGVEQVVLLSAAGAISVAPADGKVLWKYDWPGSIILQPAVTANGDLLMTSSDMNGGAGTRRLAIAQSAGGWTTQEVWTSRGLKPYFNDFVIHDGHAFGFDGSILSCIDLQDGKRVWKGGRYGYGQLLLLRDQGLLLVLSEEGELALVSASPGQFSEIAKFPALEGKTWNHLVLAGDTLLVRNGEAMVAFRLPLAGG